VRAVLLLLAVPVGLVVGGFVTMVADRVPDRRPVLRPGPRCPYCEHPLGAGDVVPVVSWLARRGRCRWCEHRITPAYPLVEVATALLYVAAVAEFGDSWAVLPFLVLYPTLVAVSVVDLYHYRIPDRITFPALVASLAIMAAVAVGYGEPGAIGWALLGAVVFFVALLVPHLISPAGMGFGDVKLALLLGLFLGWLSGSGITLVRLVLLTVILASLLGVVAGVGLGLLRRRGIDPLPDPEAPVGAADGAAGTELDATGVGVVVRPASAAFPFGPALAVATVVSTLLAEQLLGL
jgi:leader peptidase (prepilin peptidase) / N-methyltransferase